MTMQRKSNRPAWGLVLVLAVVVLMALLVLGVSLLRRCHPFDRDYSELPPKLAFRQVFQRSVLPGVTDIQVAGYAWLGGRDIWMQFRATDEAVKLLTGGSRPVSTAREPC